MQMVETHNQMALDLDRLLNQREVCHCSPNAGVAVFLVVIAAGDPTLLPLELFSRICNILLISNCG